ncbi:MAG: hypothetical protein WCP18_00180 [bacterium]
MKIKKNKLKLLSIPTGFYIVGLSLVAVLAGFGVALAWDEPLSSPPQGNISGPVNIGGGNQTKTGGLRVEQGVTTTQVCFIGDNSCISSALNNGWWAQNGANDIYNINTHFVGIGTNNPSAPLTVSLGAGITSKLLIGEADLNENPELQLGYVGGHWGMFVNNGPNSEASGFAGNLNFWNSSNRFSITSGGYVGVGTVKPATNFEVAGTNDAVGTKLRVTNTAGNPELQLQYGLATGVDHWGIYANHADQSLRFWNSSDRLVILPNGDMGIKIGINTVTPTAVLEMALPNQTKGLVIHVAGSLPDNPLEIQNDSGNPIFQVDSTGVATATDFCTASGKCLNNTTSVINVSGGGIFVGYTSSTYKGDNSSGPTKGYIGASNLCTANVVSSTHWCTSEEILGSINVGISLPAIIMWIANGPPGYLAQNNDCSGRTAGVIGPINNRNFGNVWVFPSANYPQGYGSIVTCDSTYSLACCK